MAKKNDISAQFAPLDAPTGTANTPVELVGATDAVVPNGTTSETAPKSDIAVLMDMMQVMQAEITALKTQRVPEQPKPVETREPMPRSYRPVNEIIAMLLQELQNHPDVQLGTSRIGDPVIPQGLKFPGTPSHMQHFTEIRFSHRDEMESPAVIANKPWKWQGVVDGLNAPPSPPVNEKPNPRWAHLVSPAQVPA